MVAPLKPTSPFVIPKIELNKIGTPSGPSAGTETSAASFSDKLREVVQEANEKPLAGETVAKDYADGKQNDLHGTMVSMAQADISLRLVSNVRNRAIEAYREIMRMGA